MNHQSMNSASLSAAIEAMMEINEMLDQQGYVLNEEDTQELNFN